MLLLSKLAIFECSRLDPSRGREWFTTVASSWLIYGALGPAVVSWDYVPFERLQRFAAVDSRITISIQPLKALEVLGYVIDNIVLRLILIVDLLVKFT